MDGGLFAFALNAVRRWGGVLEHPAGSKAWSKEWGFDLRAPPMAGGWVRADDQGGWTCAVEQGHYGHKAAKLTWLYAVRTARPELRWIKDHGLSDHKLTPQVGAEERGRGERSRRDAIERMSKKQRLVTPDEFRDLLIELARSVET